MSRIARGSTAGLLLLLAALPAAAGNDWPPPDADVLGVADCPAEPGCAAAVVSAETFVDNSYVNARVEIHRVVKIFKPDGLAQASFTVPFVVGSWSVKDLEGRTIRPDGSVVELDPSTTIVRTVVKATGFRSKEMLVEMPAAEVGAVLEYRYRLVYRHAFSGYTWSPQEEMPVLHSTLLAKAGVRSWEPIAINMGSIHKAMDIDPEGRARIVFRDVPSLREEPMMPPEEEVRARLTLAAPSLDLTWSRVGSAFHEYLDRYYKRSKQARKLTDQVVEGAPDSDAKIGRIYRWVQDNIDNTSFSETAEGEVESDDSNVYVDDILSSRQGTHEDLVRLFAFMAREAGFDAEVALVSTRDETFFRKDLKDIYQFNSEVAAVHAGDQWKFFDPGTRYCPLGMVGWQNEGVWENALVSREGGGILMRILPSPAEKNLEHRRFRLELDGVALTGDVEEEDHGLAGTSLRNRVDHLTEEERRTTLTDELDDLREEVTVSDLSYANLADWQEPLQVSYRIAVPAYAVSTGSRLLVPATVFPARNPFSSPDRRNDIYFTRTAKRVDEIVLAIPEGYEVESLPEAQHFDLGALKYGITFEQKEGEVQVTREMTNDVILVDVTNYARVRALYDEAARLDASQIVLRRSDGADEGEGR